MSSLVSKIRVGDMHPTRRLCISRQPDGDVIVSIHQKSISPIGDTGTGAEHKETASVEFCVSGGRSRHTREALYRLMEAIEQDNKENPIDFLSILRGGNSPSA